MELVKVHMGAPARFPVFRHAVEHGTRTVMMHNGGAIMDVSGAEKDNKTINDYLTVFNEISIECGN